MKHLLAALAILGTVLSLPIASVHAESIPSFDASIEIKKDGSYRVSETVVYDFGTSERHGMFRFIPFIRRNSEGKRFIMDIGDIRVTDDSDRPYRFSVSDEGEEKQIKIGEADKTVTGIHTYSIGYSVAGGITYFSDHDELFWQVTGTDWEAPIDQASVILTLPEPVDPESMRLVCYTGPADSSASDCTARYEEGKVRVQTTDPLMPGEGLTIVVGFPKGIVAVMEPKPKDTWLSQLLSMLVTIAVVLGSIAWYLVLPLWIVIHWFRTGRDPEAPMGVASAWFDVPKTKTRRPLTPGETGTLVDEQAGIPEISATIVDLARRGYMKIIETKKNDFTLEKRHTFAKDDTLRPFEQTLMDGLFKKGKSVRIKDVVLISTVSDVKKKLYTAVVDEGFFLTNPDAQRTRYSVLGVIGMITMNFPLILAAFLFGRAMPRKTIDGRQTANMALSLRNFLTSQKRQFAYQADKQLLFEKLLPYAVVFGVEKIWADRFKNIVLKKPDWYDGYNMRTFNSVAMVHSLDSSFRSVTSAATPTSSSSGFSSGFSGGSVGGGGGGGGGGSW